MRAYLESQGYVVLRWAEWCEDHMEFEVLTPAGERLVVDAEWLLLPVVQLRGEYPRGWAHVMQGTRSISLAA